LSGAPGDQRAGAAVLIVDTRIDYLWRYSAALRRGT
jgi:hypothetical protein